MASKKQPNGTAMSQWLWGGIEQRTFHVKFCWEWESPRAQSVPALRVPCVRDTGEQHILSPLLPCKYNVTPQASLKRAGCHEIPASHSAQGKGTSGTGEAFTELMENITFTAAELNCWVTKV